MRVRLRDVAERVGVSEATVSRVVNDRPGVNDNTRQAVLRVLAELGYGQPGVGRMSRAGLVGLLVPELDNPIFPIFAQAVETRLAAHGYTAVLCTATQEGVQEHVYVEMLLERNVAGIIIVSGLNADTSADHALYAELIARGMPLVFVNGVVPGLDAPFVSCDDRLASELAVRHLVSLGHERLGYVSGPSRYWVVQRKLEGFRAAVTRAFGRAARPLVAESVYTVEGGHVAARSLLDEGVTGIVAGSDLMALGAIRAAHDAGLGVPRHVSVVGYDDTPLMAYTDPPLTTVRQPVRQMSDAAVRALLDRIAGGTSAHEYVFRPELVVRNSTGRAPSQATHTSRRRRAG